MTTDADNANDTELTAQIIWSSFLVRFWREVDGQEWRGQVIHLQSHETRPLATLAQMQEFFTQYAPGLEAQRAAQE